MSANNRKLLRFGVAFAIAGVVAALIGMWLNAVRHGGISPATGGAIAATSIALLVIGGIAVAIATTP